MKLLPFNTLLGVLFGSWIAIRGLKWKRCGKRGEIVFEEYWT